MDNASKYLDKLESIMDDNYTSSKVKADIAMNLLDRAGYKAVEKREVSGSLSGNVSSTITLELVQRARELMAKKAETINISHDVID